MRILRTFSLLLLWFFPLGGIAQSYFFDQYNEDNGMPGAEIQCIEQDQFGYLWIGTGSGLVRFDGSRFEEIHFSTDHENDAVYDLLIDGEGRLWIAGMQGVASFDGDRFQYFGISELEAGAHCYGLAQDKDNEMLFFYGKRSLYRINKGLPEKMDEWMGDISGHVLNVAGNTLAELLIYTSEDDLWQWAGNRFESMDLENYAFDSVLFASDAKAYAVWPGGLSPIDNNFHDMDSIPRFTVKTSGILDFSHTDGEKTWISYNDGTLVTLWNDNLKEIDAEKGFHGGVVEQIFRDREHNVWLSTQQNGLFRYAGDLLMFLEDSKDPIFSPASIYRDEMGRLFVCYFGRGIDVYAEDKYFNINAADGLSSNYVRWITAYEGARWVITARGITRMKEGQYRSYSTSDGLPHNYCFHAVTDPSGSLWVATEGGVGIFKDDRFHHLDIEDGLLSNRIKFLLPCEDGSMLMLSDRGIDRYSEGKVNRFIYDELNEKEVLNTMIMDQKGNLWIGSDINGLLYYHKDKDKLYHLNPNAGLPFSRVRTLDLYRDNWLCVGTERGIYYLGISGQGEIEHIYSAGVEAGYPDFEVNQNASLQVDDAIYFGTSLGVVKFYPEKFRESPAVPVHVSALRIAFEDTDWTSRNKHLNTWVGTPLNPVLNHNENDLQISYRGVSFRNREALWYRSQLSMYDQDWSEPTRDESVIYANLSPGKYSFRVQASSDGLNWPATYAEYDFVIAPPFWRTWWFIALIFAFMLLGFVLVNNYRIKYRINQLLLIEKLNKEEQERIQKKVAMDFHDEVGNHLTSISLLVELIRSRDWDVPDELQEYLKKIDQESKGLFLGTKDFTWSIDPKNNNLREVFYKIKDYGEEVFDNTDIRFQAENVNGRFMDLKLPAGFTRQIVLIFKEAIDNAKKHASCNRVTFSVKGADDRFTIELSDNGTGFNPGEIKYFNGLKKMKGRGEKIKADVILKSDPESGTVVQLKADLNKNITS